MPTTVTRHLSPLQTDAARGQSFHSEYEQRVDMRASYDTLFEKARSVLNQDPFSGHLFLFMNKGRTSIKCLYFDGTGLVIIAKRMERGLFGRINPYHRGEIVLTAAEFALYFEGADLEKRFIESPSEIKKTVKKTFPMSQELHEISL